MSRARLHPPIRSAFESDHAEQLEAYLVAQHGGRSRISGLAGGRRYRSTLVNVGAFSVRQVSAPVHVAFRVDSLPGFMIMHQQAGTLERIFRGRKQSSHRVQAGQVLLVAQPGEEVDLRCQDRQGHGIRLNPTLLHDVAATVPTQSPVPLRFTGCQPTTPSAAAHWIRTCGYVEHLLDNPETADQLLILGSAARLLAATALVCFPNNAVSDPTRQDRIDAATTTVRRAIAYIEAHPDHDVTVADLAVHCRVSIRAVQLAFRRHLNVTPTAYLRQARLDLAHRDLLRASPHDTTVAQIAARWGFASHSRFTALYHTAYGIPPSHTLKGPI